MAMYSTDIILRQEQAHLNALIAQAQAGAEQAPSQSQLDILRCEIADVADRVTGLAQDLDAMATRIFGSPPPKAVGAEPLGAAVSLVAQLHEQVSRARYAVTEAEENFRRLRELA